MENITEITTYICALFNILLIVYNLRLLRRSEKDAEWLSSRIKKLYDEQITNRST